jgi:hypothetical protein
MMTGDRVLSNLHGYEWCYRDKGSSRRLSEWPICGVGKSLWLTSHTWLGLNPQIGRPLSRIVVPLVYFCLSKVKWMVRDGEKDAKIWKSEFDE